MKFELSTTGGLYENKEDIARLELLGFSFKKGKYGFLIDGNPEVEINTIQELVDFTKTYGEIIVKEGKIEIFDDYR